jgi:DNA-binding response OmpR family regulator
VIKVAKRIMIVDDEPQICQAIKAVLEPEGFEVMTALSGPECWEKLQKEKVDLVLIDFFMPGMSGRALCEWIRKDPKLKGLRVAFLTAARFGDVGMEKLRELKALDYIQKPFGADDLVKRVKRMLSK